MIEIKIRGGATIVDLDDMHIVESADWRVNSAGYAMFRKSKNWPIRWLHREIANTPVDMFTDHINGNRLDNIKSNLRICNKSQNQMNRIALTQNTSGFKGVCFDKENSKWIATITQNGKNRRIGRFSSKIEAAMAYDKAAIETFGSFARTNSALGRYDEIISVPAGTNQ